MTQIICSEGQAEFAPCLGHFLEQSAAPDFSTPSRDPRVCGPAVAALLQCERCYHYYEILVE